MFVPVAYPVQKGNNALAPPVKQIQQEINKQTNRKQKQEQRRQQSIVNVSCIRLMHRMMYTSRHRHLAPSGKDTPLPQGNQFFDNPL